MRNEHKSDIPCRFNNFNELKKAMEFLFERGYSIYPAGYLSLWLTQGMKQLLEKQKGIKCQETKIEEIIKETAKKETQRKMWKDLSREVKKIRRQQRRQRRAKMKRQKQGKKESKYYGELTMLPGGKIFVPKSPFSFSTTDDQKNKESKSKGGAKMRKTQKAVRLVVKLFVRIAGGHLVIEDIKIQPSTHKNFEELLGEAAKRQGLEVAPIVSNK